MPAIDPRKDRDQSRSAVWSRIVWHVLEILGFIGLVAVWVPLPAPFNEMLKQLLYPTGVAVIVVLGMIWLVLHYKAGRR
jgi:hypothetical protein